MQGGQAGGMLPALRYELLRRGVQLPAQIHIDLIGEEQESEGENGCRRQQGHGNETGHQQSTRRWAPSVLRLDTYWRKPLLSSSLARRQSLVVR